MKKALLAMLTATMVISVSLKAQEQLVDPPSKSLSTIPFTILTGGVIILNAQLDNFSDTLNFILDTGSSGISLDSATVAFFNLQPEKSDRMIRGIAGVRGVSFLRNRLLRFPGYAVDSLDFHITDYEMLTAIYGVKIDGIIGFSLLSRYIIKIDYDNLLIQICSQGPIRYPKGGHMLRPVFDRRIPAQSARVFDNKKIHTRFLYDIGAGVCLMLSSDFVTDSAILKKKKKMLAKEGEGLGGKIALKTAVIKEFKLGPYRFRKVPTYIFNDDFDVTAYPSMGGILGNDILRRFNCIINYARREFYLTPNTHYSDPFDYSYSGIELYLIDGEIVIGYVAEKSEAQKAGVKVGDKLIGLNNILGQHLDRYKQALQAINTTIRIIISRNGEVKEIKFKITSIL